MKVASFFPVPALVLLAVVVGLAWSACGVPRPPREAGSVPAPGGERPGGGRAGAPAARLRLALFNVRELSAEKLASVDATGAGSDPQLLAAAAVVQRLRPDVLVVQEIDFPYGAADPTAHARAFAERYLARGEAPIGYPHLFAAPVNTGLLSGFDLDQDGQVATEADRGERSYGDDSLGWGTYPGQYGMAVLSRYPLAAAEVRTFQRFLWRDLPGHHLPPGYYSQEELALLPLSSKSHWDLPVEVPPAAQGAAPRRLHLWISHPTPPVFDGDEDRNGRRNFDEIRFWKLYLEGSPALVDDRGRAGAYGTGVAGGPPPFVVVGDLNADPHSPEAVYDGVQASRQLLAHPKLVDAGELLVSEGARARPRVGEERMAEPHRERSTADFQPAMRLDHLIPGGGARPLAGGVYWPAAEADPEGHELAAAASDHRLVWLDLELP